MGQRSKVSALPAAVKAWLDKALVEGNFSGYEALEAELKGRGFDIGKSSLHRYGSEFEKRLGAIRMASEQARVIVGASPDDEGAVSEALMRLVQEKLFSLLVESDNEDINLPKIARAVADLGRTTISQKKWQADVRDKVAAKFRDMEAQAQTGKKAGFDIETLRRVREEIYGIVG